MTRSNLTSGKPLRRTAPAVTGMAIRNENEAAASRRRPVKSPPEIVLPDRETPRNNADTA